MRVRNRWMGLGMACVLVGIGVPAMGLASAAAKNHGDKALQTQVEGVEAKVSKAREQNDKLQAQVTRLEQQNADRQKQLQQRDQEIAALQRKLQAAGVQPAAGSSAP